MATRKSGTCPREQRGNSVHLIANMVWADEFRIPMAIWITECPDARTEMKCIDIHFGSWLKCIPIDVLFPRLIFTSSAPFFGFFCLQHVHFSNSLAPHLPVLLSTPFFSISYVCVFFRCRWHIASNGFKLSIVFNCVKILVLWTQTVHSHTIVRRWMRRARNETLLKSRCVCARACFFYSVVLFESFAWSKCSIMRF